MTKELRALGWLLYSDYKATKGRLVARCRFSDTVRGTELDTAAVQFDPSCFGGGTEAVVDDVDGRDVLWSVGYALVVLEDLSGHVWLRHFKGCAANFVDE